MKNPPPQDAHRRMLTDNCSCPPAPDPKNLESLESSFEQAGQWVNRWQELGEKLTSDLTAAISCSDFESARETLHLLERARDREGDAVARRIRLYAEIRFGDAEVARG